MGVTMSVLAAVARTRVAPSRSQALQITRRSLGDSYRGPQDPFHIAQNWAITKTWFTSEPVSYAAYKQQCVSMRVFAFAGTMAFVLGNLYFNPPKSSYWARYSPSFIPGNLGGLFAPSSAPLFLSAKSEGTDVPNIAAQLITTRRLPGAGDDEEDEH